MNTREDIKYYENCIKNELGLIKNGVQLEALYIEIITEDSIKIKEEKNKPYANMTAIKYWKANIKLYKMRLKWIRESINLYSGFLQNSELELKKLKETLAST